MFWSRKRENKSWFCPKRYGWGFVPVSWEGRLFSLLLVGVTLGAGYRNGFFAPTGLEPTIQQAVSFLIDLYLIIFASLWYMDKKTDGELKRRRGDDD